MLCALGTYRAFKFPFVANPDYPPDIYSNVSSFANTTTTSVFASWNGATEVASWTLHKTNEEGERTLQPNSVSRSGFETRIDHGGYAKYVFVEAKDMNGKTLGKSKIIETLESGDVSTVAIAEEVLWLKGGPDVPVRTGDLSRNPIATFIAGIFCGAVILSVTVFVTRRGFGWWHGHGRQVYERVDGRDAAEGDETKLDDLSPARSYRDDMDSDVSKVSEEDKDADD